MKVVGKSNVQYISKRTQNEVKGISLHCVGKKSNVEGEAVETQNQKCLSSALISPLEQKSSSTTIAGEMSKV